MDFWRVIAKPLPMLVKMDLPVPLKLQGLGSLHCCTAFSRACQRTKVKKLKVCVLTDTCDLPKSAIRPYPTQYVSNWTLKDGTLVTIRPIRPDDEPLAVKFHETLSEESVYFRYFHMLKLQTRVAHDRLSRLCFIDYDCEMALVADRKNPQTGEREILGIGRLSKLHGCHEAEFSMLISDRFQCQGLGTELLRRLLEIGKDEKLQYITAEILSENRAMQKVCQQLGFRFEPVPGESIVKVVYESR